MSSNHLLRGVMAVAMGAGLVGVALLGISFGYSLKPEAQFGFTAHPLFASGLGCVIAGAFSGLMLTHIRRAN